MVHSFLFFAAAAAAADPRQIASEILVQIFGFLCVFFILKRFAWGKLLGVMDARRAKIEEDLAEAEKQKTSVEGLKSEYRKKIDQIEQEARARIQEAANLGQSLAKDIQEKARQDADKMVERAKTEIHQDIVKAKASLRNEVVELSGLMAEKVIREKLDAKAHKKLVDKFLQDIEEVS